MIKNVIKTILNISIICINLILNNMIHLTMILTPIRVNLSTSHAQERRSFEWVQFSLGGSDCGVPLLPLTGYMSETFRGSSLVPVPVDMQGDPQFHMPNPSSHMPLGDGTLSSKHNTTSFINNYI